ALWRLGSDAPAGLAWSAIACWITADSCQISAKQGMDHPERVASQMSGGTHLAAQSSTAQRRKGVAATSLPAEAGKLPMRLFAPTKR
ncbi:hypothetical protein BRL79_09810, partial [Xanthomonas oryzae pv. oryzae]